MPYSDIPTQAAFVNDTKIFWTFSSRNSDHTLVNIDGLLEKYAAVALVDQVDVLYYLYLATNFWLKKEGKVLKNTPPTGYADTAKGTLPTTGKMAANGDRRGVIQDLNDIVVAKLCTATGANSTIGLRLALADIYDCPNHSRASDDAWLQNHPADDITTTFLTDDGVRRRYKLRFREGLAYRWAQFNDNSCGYAKFDTMDRRESETNDTLCHFAMDKRGRIFVGFARDVIWFKHSSLLGGEPAQAAGRMRLEAGKVTHIVNDSGHYQPGARHMVNLLQRLSNYGMNLNGITVQRISDREEWDAVRVVNALSKWPDQ